MLLLLGLRVYTVKSLSILCLKPLRLPSVFRCKIYRGVASASSETTPSSPASPSCTVFYVKFGRGKVGDGTRGRSHTSRVRPCSVMLEHQDTRPNLRGLQASIPEHARRWSAVCFEQRSLVNLPLYAVPVWFIAAKVEAGDTRQACIAVSGQQARQLCR